MRRRLRYFRLFALMTVILGIVAGVYLRVRKPFEPPTGASEPLARFSKRLVVAAIDIMPRTLLTSDLLDEKEVEIVPEGAFKSKDEVINRLTKVLIRKGEPIFQQHVTPPLKEISAAHLIPSGQVGMAIAISRPETVPPLRTGDYISIHAVFAGMKVRTIAQRAMVLAVNNRIDGISIVPYSEPSPNFQQQQKTQSPELEKMVIFIALPLRDAKAVALALDSGATFYYTLHSSPIQPFPLLDLERDLTLQELTGSREVTSFLLRKQHVELPNSNPHDNRESRPLQPMTVEPLHLREIEGSVRNLSQRVERLESNFREQKPFEKDKAREHRIIGVIGDQKVTFTVPQSGSIGGKQK